MTKKLIGYVLAIFAALGTVSAQAEFVGRDSNGAPNSSCGNTCTFFYDTNLDITILNNWNIGIGVYVLPEFRYTSPNWIYSAQYKAEQAGYNASGLTDWRLPTGSLYAAAGSSNEFKSIWNDAGGSLAALQNRFYNVPTCFCTQYTGIYDRSGDAAYYTSSFSFVNGLEGYVFSINSGTGNASPYNYREYFALAVRNGDIANDLAPVPLPASVWMLLSGLGGLGLLAKKRKGAK